MRPPSKQLFVFCVALVFAVAMWCASLAAPGQALASVTGCSQNGGPMKMTGCAQLLCGLESSANVLSQGALASARVNAPLKGALGIAVGEVSIASADGAVPLGWMEFASAFAVRPGKVSIRLFNSVFNL
jgi:hypothetical protein